MSENPDNAKYYGLTDRPSDQPCLNPIEGSLRYLRRGEKTVLQQLQWSAIDSQIRWYDVCCLILNED